MKITPPNMDAALDAAERLATGTSEPEPGAEPLPQQQSASAPAVDSGPRPTAVRLNSAEYEFIKTTFAEQGHGLKVGTGVKMAAIYVAEKVARGELSISRAGIREIQTTKPSKETA
jgi:hypothetical protein